MRLTIDLPPDASSLIDEAVRSGGFADASAVVAAALQAMRGRHDDLLGYEMDELRRLGDEGEASGPGRPLDIDAIMQEVAKRTRSAASEA